MHKPAAENNLTICLYSTYCIYILFATFSSVVIFNLTILINSTSEDELRWARNVDINKHEPSKSFIGPCCRF